MLMLLTRLDVCHVSSFVVVSNRLYSLGRMPHQNDEGTSLLLRLTDLHVFFFSLRTLMAKQKPIRIWLLCSMS